MDELKDIFTYNPDIRKNAYLNWRFNETDSDEVKFSKLGNAYFEVAANLINNCLEDNITHRLDGWIFPILFDIYQGLELYLKAYHRILFPEDKITKGGHNIRCISQEIFNKLLELKTVDVGIEDLYKGYKVIEEFIAMLYKNTSTNVTFVRYPMDNTPEDFFYIGGREQGNIVIDIEQLANWLNIAHSALESQLCFWDARKNPENYM